MNVTHPSVEEIILDVQKSGGGDATCLNNMYKQLTVTPL